MNKTPYRPTYEQEARRIIEMVKKEFVMSDGALFLERDARGNAFLHNIFSDLGDVAPFFLYFGETEFIETQARLYKKSLKEGFLVSEFPSLKVSGLVKSYEYTDLLLGLLSLSEAIPTEEYSHLLADTAEASKKAFAFTTHMRSFYHPRLHVGLPIIDTRDATLIECFTSLYRSTNDEKYLSYAKDIFRHLIQTPFYVQHALFADYEPTNAFARILLRNNPKVRQATLCKNTTNALFAFLDLYRITKEEKVLDELHRMSRAVIMHAMREDGSMIEKYIPGIQKTSAYLTGSFPILDFLCDLSAEITEEREWALMHARKIADYWITQQGDTGLFPSRGAVGNKEDFFDSETDVTVAFYKLAEITGEHKYYDAAERCLSGILTYHAPEGYVLGVDVATGAITDKTRRTKFLCLFLKVLILKMEQEKGKTIYGDAKLFELLKDR
jgi:uncharacterized protein YyaL (SSP411 family)